jgi:hypothetical protein
MQRESFDRRPRQPENRNPAAESAGRRINASECGFTAIFPIFGLHDAADMVKTGQRAS